MNVLKPFKKTTVLTLVQNGISQHEIARKTGVDRKTIRKYQALAPPGVSNSPMATGSAEQPTFGVSGAGPPVETPCEAVPPQLGTPPAGGKDTPRQSVSACGPHHDWIKGEVEKGRNAMAIYQDLVERFGFSNRYNSVKRYVRKLKRKDPEQYDRLEFLPGEEAQVDYGQGAFTKRPKTGKRRRPRLFVMTLRYSRRAFRKTVWNSSKETWAKLHEEAFRYFGGCPQYVVLDNLKEGVLKPDIYEPELNPVYSAMLAHYGVVADPARVGDPDRKGTVENAIQHTQNTALKGREFETIEEQNQWLMHWEERWAAPRVHGRTKRQVVEMFLEEKPFLKPLPLQSFRTFVQEVRTVWDDGCIEVKRSYYSALPAPLFSKVMVRIYGPEIEIYDPKTLLLLRRHMKCVKPGGAKMEESDRIFNPSRMTQSFLDQAAKIGPKTRELCEVLFKEQGRVGERRMRGILSLAKRHSAPVIEEASRMAIDRYVRSSKTVRELVLRLEEKGNKEKQQTFLPALTQSHDLIRPPNDYALFWEEQTKKLFVGGKQTITTITKEQHHADVTTGNRTNTQNLKTTGDPGHPGNPYPSGEPGGLVLPRCLLPAVAGRDGPQKIADDRNEVQVLRTD